MAYHKHYDPNQPRIPAGHPDGGEWTAGGYRKNPHTQTAFLAPILRLGGRVLGPVVGGAGEKGIEASLALFAALSAHNSRDKRAIIAFKAHEFGRPAAENLALEHVRMLDRKEVNEICERLDDVQKITDRATLTAKLEKPYLKQPQFGTEVHGRIKKKIDDNGRGEIEGRGIIVEDRRGNLRHAGLDSSRRLRKSAQRHGVCVRHQNRTTGAEYAPPYRNPGKSV